MIELSDPPKSMRTHRIPDKRWRSMPPISADKIAIAEKMEAAGKQRKQIAAELGVSRWSLLRYLGPKRHWSRHPAVGMGNIEMNQRQG